MWILVLMMNVALAATPNKSAGCGPYLELTEDRGNEFRDRVGVLAAEWFSDPAEPRRPRVLKYNVVEVQHRADGGGSAVVELLTHIGSQRVPILVRVRYEPNRVADFSIIDQGYLGLSEREAGSAQFAQNAAVAKLLTSTAWPVKDHTTKVLSSWGHGEHVHEILVSASINGAALEKIYTVVLSKGAVTRVDESALERYPRSLLARRFTELLLGQRKDPTLRITAIDRQTAHSWRVLYTQGKMERVDEDKERPSRSKRRSSNCVEIRADEPAHGRAVFRGDGWLPRVMILRVDADHEFSLIDDPRR